MIVQNLNTMDLSSKHRLDIKDSMLVRSFYIYCTLQVTPYLKAITKSC